jgi:hypothetical protein
MAEAYMFQRDMRYIACDVTKLQTAVEVELAEVKLYWREVMTVERRFDSTTGKQGPTSVIG